MYDIFCARGAVLATLGGIQTESFLTALACFHITLETIRDEGLIGAALTNLFDRIEDETFGTLSTV